MVWATMGGLCKGRFGGFGRGWRMTGRWGRGEIDKETEGQEMRMLRRITGVTLRDDVKRGWTSERN